jgi:hypothetical protein
MRINLKQTIRDYAGKELTQPMRGDNNQPVLDEDGRPVTEPQILRDLLTTALNNAAPNETLTAEQKGKIYQLSLKIWSGKEADFTVDDRAFLKERVNLIFVSPMLCGRICDILEGNETEAEATKAVKG